jgi:hypothetical protein
MRRFALVLIVLLLSACAAVPPAPRKIALLAPFEGQYREIGYEALYAAQLSLQDVHSTSSYIILPLDDGGTESTARERASALTYDSSIVFVLALGPYATTPAAQAAYGDLPVLMVGYWPSIPQRKTIAALTADLRDVLPIISDPALYPDEGLIGAELLSLPQFDEREGCTVWSSARLIDEAFAVRYAAINQFAPPPRLITPLTHDAVSIALKTLQEGVPLRSVEIKGLGGDIAFNDEGYWRDAEIYQYGCGDNRE